MALIKLNNNSISAVTELPAGVGGKVLQVQSTFYNVPFTQAISAETDTSINTTNLKVDITPTSTLSKIMLFGRLFQEMDYDGGYNVSFFFRRGTTSIGVGVAEGLRPAVMTMNHANYIQNGAYDRSSTPETANLFHIDSPASISQQSYYIGVRTNASNTIYVNKTVSDSNNSGCERGSSEIIAMEIL